MDGHEQQLQIPKMQFQLKVIYIQLVKVVIHHQHHVQRPISAADLLDLVLHLGLGLRHLQKRLCVNRLPLPLGIPLEYLQLGAQILVLARLLRGAGLLRRARRGRAGSSRAPAGCACRRPWARCSSRRAARRRGSRRGSRRGTARPIAMGVMVIGMKPLRGS